MKAKWIYTSTTTKHEQSLNALWIERINAGSSAEQEIFYKWAWYVFETFELRSERGVRHS
jgi:ribosomal protein L20